MTGFETAVHPLTAYVVESQSLLVPYLLELLERAKIDVVGVAPRLDTATLSELDPDIVFIDPEFDVAFPREIVRLARATVPHARICVYVSAGDVADYRGAGADAVIPKELDADAFVDSMSTLMGRGPQRPEQ